MTKTTIEIDENLIVRLSVYRHENGLSSWADTIAHLLDWAENRAQSNGAAIATHPNVAETATYMPGRLEIVYRGGEGNVVSESEFKRQLIQHQKALVRLHYTNGESADRYWRASNITEDSSIRGNLSSGYLRGYRNEGICKAEVMISLPARRVP